MKIIYFTIIVFLLISCTKNKVQQSIYGKWIDTEDGSITINLDSSKNIININYKKSPENNQSSTFILKSENEIVCECLYPGTKLYIDDNSNLNFLLIKKYAYQEMMEVKYDMSYRKVFDKK